MAISSSSKTFSPTSPTHQLLCLKRFYSLSKRLNQPYYLACKRQCRPLLPVTKLSPYLLYHVSIFIRQPVNRFVFLHSKFSIATIFVSLGSFHKKSRETICLYRLPACHKTIHHLKSNSRFISCFHALNEPFSELTLG